MAGATKWPPTTAVSTRACARSITWWCSTSKATRMASCSRSMPCAIPRARSCAASTPMRTRRMTGRIACRSTSSAPAAPSQAAIDFVNMTGIRNETAEQFVASAYVSGDLPATRPCRRARSVCAGPRIPDRAGQIGVRRAERGRRNLSERDPTRSFRRTCRSRKRSLSSAFRCCAIRRLVAGADRRSGRADIRLQQRDRQRFGV